MGSCVGFHQHNPFLTSATVHHVEMFLVESVDPRISKEANISKRHFSFFSFKRSGDCG